MHGEGEVGDAGLVPDNRTAVLDNIQKVREKVKENDLFVVFFAGHGVKEKDQFYLLTVEAQAARPKVTNRSRGRPVAYGSTSSSSSSSSSSRSSESSLRSSSASRSSSSSSRSSSSSALSSSSS